MNRGGVTVVYGVPKVKAPRPPFGAITTLPRAIAAPQMTTRENACDKIFANSAWRS
jgi:hypothetical protein